MSLRIKNANTLAIKGTAAMNPIFLRPVGQTVHQINARQYIQARSLSALCVAELLSGFDQKRVDAAHTAASNTANVAVLADS